MSKSNTNTYTLKNYSVVISLNERTIYFKITDTVSFYQYEGNVDIKELRLNIELNDAYTIITNCFEGLVEGYRVIISVNSNVLKLQFNALVGGFLKMEFEVMLREKVMSNDGQLTINFNRLEQKLNAGLQKLEQRCKELEGIIKEKNEELLNLADKLSYAHICMTYAGCPPNPSHFIHLNIKELNCQFSNDQSSFKYEMIEKLYQLEKLTTTYFRASNFTSVKMKSNSLKELYIQSQNEATITSLEGINEIPNLEKITIIGASALTNIPTVLKSYKHKINYIKIQSCAQVNVVELQTYCQTNNIKLEIS
jgi:hypothetical protein